VLGQHLSRLILRKKLLKTYEPRHEYNGFGDLNIGLEYGLGIRNQWNFSGTLTLGIPSESSEGGKEGSYQTRD